MSLSKFTVVCVAALAICGCDQGQPTPSAPTPDKQATSAVTSPDFAATNKDAESGDAKAQYRLGLMYYNGDGVPQDYAEAVKWSRLAADQGLAAAQFNLAVMYEIGQSVPQDYAEAVKWSRLAADQGDVMAQCKLGMMYDNGHGVAQDDAEAYVWFSVAAAGGDAEAFKLREATARELNDGEIIAASERATELLEKMGSRK